MSGIVIATYENIDVVRGVNYDEVKTCVAALPVTPYLLPDGQGLVSVYPSGFPFQEYYPIPRMMVSAWLKDPRVKSLIGEFYCWDSGKVTIFDDLFSGGVTPTVDMQLAILDINRLGDNDPLPIPPEYLADIVTAVIARYQEPDTMRKETDQPSPSNRN